MGAEREPCGWGRGVRNWIRQHFTRLIIPPDSIARNTLNTSFAMTAPVVALLIALAGPADTTRLLPERTPVRDSIPAQVIPSVEDSVSAVLPPPLLSPPPLGGSSHT